MTYKHVLVQTDLHNQVKAHAALLGQTIREYTENALAKRLETFSLPSTVKESPNSYEASTRQESA